MKVFATVASLLVASAAAAPAAQTTIQKVGYGPSALVRAPAHDSASIESHRFGGNFAYATAEAHAYASVTPEISKATFPVAEHTHVQEAPVIATVKKAPIVNTHHAATPVLAQEPVLAKQALVGPVAAHTTVHQPLAKVQTVQHHVSQPVAAVAYAQPAVVAAPAKVAVAAAPAKVAVAAAPAVAYAQAAPALAAAPLAGGYAYAQPGLGYAAAPAVIA